MYWTYPKHLLVPSWKTSSLHDPIWPYWEKSSLSSFWLISLGRFLTTRFAFKSKSESFFLLRTICLLSIIALFISERHLSYSSASRKFKYPNPLLLWDSLSNITLAPYNLKPRLVKYLYKSKSKVFYDRFPIYKLNWGPLSLFGWGDPEPLLV